MKNARLLILLLALLTFGQAWAQGLSGSGTTQDPYLITSNADWTTFAQSVTNGTTYSGQTVKLTADITVSTMAGVENKSFAGTFDGDGHTITLALSGSGNGTALFSDINGATLKNLKAQGNVTTDDRRPATFVVFVFGNSTISNCWSTVAVSSTRTSGWVDGGGMVSRVSSNATLNMTDCAFHGTVTFTTGATSGGGMIGYTQSNATVNLTNCLYSPTALTLNVNEYNPRIFVSGEVSGNLTNCYYNAVAAASVLANQGIDASEMTNAALAAALGKSWHVYNGMVVPYIGEYVISSTAEWNTFAQSVTDGKTYAGQILKLTNDISVTTMAGDENTSFAGAFDGQGHVITLNMTASVQFTSLFCNADGATFQNLKVDGTINTSKKFCAGFAGAVINNGCTFFNCVSDVTINSSINGDGTHGGLVAYVGKGNNTFEGCAFTGKLLGANTNYVGGLVGFTDSRNNATVSFTNCVFHPQQVTMSGSGSQTFARWYSNNSGSVSIGDNCYYSQTLGGAQGKQMRSITGGEYVTMAFSGNATNYDLSGINAYSMGIVYGSTLYAGNGETVSLNLSCTPPTGYVCSGYTTSAGTLTGTANPYTLTMPNEEVTIQAVLEQSTTAVAYIDENGVEQQCTSYTVVTDTLDFDDLPAGWYVVNDSITLDRQVHFSGDANLILCDGATMNISVDGSEPAPGLSIDPMLIFEELGEDDMTMVQVSIENAGNSIGDWTGWLDFGVGNNGEQTADLYYHNGEVGSSIDFSDTNTQEMGIRLPGTAYAGSAMGMKITSVQYYIPDYQSADNNYIFRIYGQGLHNQPGELLAEKTISSTAIEEWITATFDEEIYMTGQVMWATVQIVQAAGEYPLSMDGGEYGEESDGNWLSTNGDSFSHCYSAGDYGGAWLINVNCQGELIPATWATLDKTEGAVMGGQIETINLTLNSIGMADGEYNATLIINTNDEDMAHVEIPVFLGVSDGVGRAVNQLASVYPTPTNSMVTLGRSNTNNRISNGNALQADGSLTLYGQSAGTGSLTATSDDGNGIHATNLTINGGTLTTNEIYSPTVTLGWSNTTDRITVGSFDYSDTPTVSVKSGQAFYYIDDGEMHLTDTVVISGTLNENQINAISGKTLVPYSLDPVAYVDGDGTEHTCSYYTVLEGGGATTLTEGWYVVDDDITYNGILSLNGDVTLILGNSKTMTMGTDDEDNGGIKQSSTGNLTVYGQSLSPDEAGTLNATQNRFPQFESGFNVITATPTGRWRSINVSNYTQHSGNVIAGAEAGKAISADSFVINGGSINANSSDFGIFSNGNITINGGNVIAGVDFGKAISANSITINGGSINANSKDYGIFTNGDMNINGGSIHVTSNNFGIYTKEDMNINGGNVTASVYHPSMFWCGLSGENNIIINGGTVESNGIYTFNNIILGFTKISDHIHATNYYTARDGTVSVKSGETFYYENGNDTVVVSGTLTTEEIAAIAGKTLRPYIEPCAPPFELEVTDISATTATLHWMGIQDSYNVRYRTFERAGTWVETTVSTTTLDITDLEPETEYVWQVQGIDCDGEDGVTEWSEIATFTTLDENTKVFVNEGDWGDDDNWIPIGVPTIDNDVILRANATVTDIAEANLITFEGTPTPTLTLLDGEDGPAQLKTNNPVKATVMKHITGYGPDNNTQNDYYLITTPIVSNPITTDPITAGLITSIDDNPTYDLYRWDRTAQNEEWQNYKVQSFNMSNGIGYLYANANTVDLYFTGTIRANNTDYTVIPAYSEDTENGWNLYGNPFVCDAYLTSDTTAMAYYILEGEHFEATTDPVASMQGVFIQTPASGRTVTFSRTAPVKQGQLNLSINQGNTKKDNVIVRFGEGNTLRKLSFFENSSKLFITIEGEDYAMVNAGNTGEVPVSFKAENDGTYTLSFNCEDVAFSRLRLIDHLTGEEIDLLAGPSTYTFDAHISDVSDRFTLVYKIVETH